MRCSRHFVEFVITIDEHRDIFAGVIRPVSLTIDTGLEADWEGLVNPVRVSSSYKPAVSEKLRSQRTAKWGDSNVHCCTYYCGNGRCDWTDWDSTEKCSNWHGSEKDWKEVVIVCLILDEDPGWPYLVQDPTDFGRAAIKSYV